MNKKQITMVTAALILGNIMAGLDATIINTAIPSIISDLHGIQFLGWIIAIFLLGMSVSIPIWTKIGEKITNKLAFELSLILFILGSTFEGFAPNIYFFIVARLVMGIGAGGMGSLPYIIVGYLFHNIKKRTKILGYLTASFNAAAIMGPLVGGVLIDSFSWHWVFYINIPIGLIAIVISLIYFHPITPKVDVKFDLLGACMLAAGLILFLLGIQLLGVANIWVTISLIILSLIVMILFFRHEGKAQNAIIPPNIFKTRELNGDFLLFAFAWGSFIAVNTYLPMWAQALLGMSALIGGMTLIPNSLSSIIASQTVATIQEHLSTFYLVLIGLICMMISVGGMFLADLNTSLIALTIVCAFSGMGVGFIFVALQVKVQIDAGAKNMATATSTSYLIRILSQTIMSAIYGVILNMALNKGIAIHKGITLPMMNKLSDSKSVGLLPQHLVPTMRIIFHSGIKNIMGVAFCLLVISVIINFYFNFRKALRVEKY